MTGPFAFINDSFVPAADASLRISDLAIQRGYGVFDFFRTVGDRPAFLDDHLDRFYHSASRMRLEVGKSRAELKSLLAELIARNAIPDSGVRITLTGGYSPDGYNISAPNLLITQKPLPVNRELAARGAQLITHPHQRQFADAKTIDYTMAVWLQPLVRERSADDVLYHHDGVVSECPRSNFFIVRQDGALVTPGTHILKGVVRKQVLRLAAGHFPTEEGVVRLQDIRHAREAFITSTTKGVLPVVQVDGASVGTGRPGEVARWLGAAFSALVAKATG